MKIQHNDFFSFPGPGQIAGNQGKKRNPQDQDGRNQADEKIRGPVVFEKDLEKGGLQDDRKSKAPEQFHQGDAGCILYEICIFECIHCPAFGVFYKFFIL